MRFPQWIPIVALLTVAAHGQTGASLYRGKCATCHGAKGEGRAAIKNSSLLTEEAKKRTDAELTAAIAKGGTKQSSAHAYERKGVSAEQVQLLVQHVRELQH
jgi:mono/diheme cytochrome c family protein